MDSDHRIKESKSFALPLGDTPMNDDYSIIFIPAGFVKGFRQKEQEIARKQSFRPQKLFQSG